MKNFRLNQILVAFFCSHCVLGHASGLGFTTNASSGPAISGPVTAMFSSVNLVGNQLTINGTFEDDQIFVYPKSKREKVKVESEGRPRGVTIETNRMPVKLDEAMAEPVKADISLLVVSLNGAKYEFPAAFVNNVKIQGFGGDDKIINGTNKNSFVNGHAGDDIIYGGSGFNSISGDHGDDKLFGSSGMDDLFGGDGNDIIKGFGGNDYVYGGAGEDYLYGGTGNDVLAGQSGKDTLVSVGGSADSLDGGTEADVFWMDENDIRAGVIDQSETAHLIKQFREFSLNGGTTVTPIELEPLGEDLPDPTPAKKHSENPAGNYSLKSFSNRPLFSSMGAGKDDIFQGDGVGDCYFLAKLSAYVDAYPDFARNTVAPLGDGSYVVHMIRNGTDDYVRVDADLWVSTTTELPLYAGLGQEDSIWVAILEKAFAIARKDQGSYSSIVGGGNQVKSYFNWVNGEVYESFDMFHYDDSLSADRNGSQYIANWDKNGRPSGDTKNNVNQEVLDLLNWIKVKRDMGIPMSTGSLSSLSNSSQLKPIPDDGNKKDGYWRRAKHIYMVDHVTTNATGIPTGIVLRDPYGIYKTITDFARIYFHIGKAVTLEERI